MEDCECDVTRLTPTGLKLGFSVETKKCNCNNFRFNNVNVKLTDATGWCLAYPSIIPITLFHPSLCALEGHNLAIPGYPGDRMDLWYTDDGSPSWVFNWGSLQFDNQPWLLTGANDWESVSLPFGFGPTTFTPAGCRPGDVPGPVGFVYSDAGGTCNLEIEVV